jgi:hypothetical protein
MKRVQIHVGMRDRESAFHFHSTLFDVEPAMLKADDAKGALEELASTWPYQRMWEGRPGIILAFRPKVKKNSNS